MDKRIRKVKEEKFVLNIPCFKEEGILRLKMFIGEVTVNNNEKWDISYSGANLIIYGNKNKNTYRVPFENILRSIYMIEEKTN